MLHLSWHEPPASWDKLSSGWWTAVLANHEEGHHSKPPKYIKFEGCNIAYFSGPSLCFHFCQCLNHQTPYIAPVVRPQHHAVLWAFIGNDPEFAPIFSGNAWKI